MNILYLSLSKVDVEQRAIYCDLMRRFRNEGHNVYVVMPNERHEGMPTTLKSTHGVHYLNVHTLNVLDTYIIEKGLGQLSLEFLYMRAIKKYLADVNFDLITYSTPPITFTRLIRWAKKMNPVAKTYLMLKDIFPQNAVDMGLLNDKGFKFNISGIKYLLYRYFRKREIELYQLSDWIGCMSPANVRYVIEHNPSINPTKVEICPNSFEPHDFVELTEPEKSKIRRQYGLPADRPIFLYGGNLSKPQGIAFLIDCLKANCTRTDCHFLIVGKGTEYERLEAFMKAARSQNITVVPALPKEEYDRLAKACDVGLIFLDYKFTIPNYPSRLLPYLMARKPIIACTDPNCDTGSLAEANGYGLWAPSNSVESFTETVNKMLASDIKEMGEKGYQFYLNNNTDMHTYDAIMKHFR